MGKIFRIGPGRPGQEPQQPGHALRFTGQIHRGRASFPTLDNNLGKSLGAGPFKLDRKLGELCRTAPQDEQRKRGRRNRGSRPGDQNQIGHEALKRWFVNWCAARHWRWDGWKERCESVRPFFPVDLQKQSGPPWE
jgi:hypothetical protein